MNVSGFRFEKLRMPLAWIGGLFLFLASKPTDMGFRIGIPIAVAGLLLRAWASGYIEKKSKELATGGPFAFLRNPLYLGNFLIGIGVIVIVQNWIVTAVYLIGFVALYVGTIRKEEAQLRQRFGKPYERYLNEVPGYFPRWTPYPQRHKTSFQWRLLIKHRELETFLGVALVLVGLYLWEEIVREGTFELKEKITISVGLALIVGLFLERLLRAPKNSSVENPPSGSV